MHYMCLIFGVEDIFMLNYCRKQIFDRCGNSSDKIMSIIVHSDDDESEIQNPVFQGIYTESSQDIFFQGTDISVLCVDKS